MSKQDEAGLILKLYELRREETMRKARDWFAQEFHPTSFEDSMQVMMSDKSAYMRMVGSYWEMAAALVNQGAISQEMFDATNGEHIGVFAKIEPILAEMRSTWNMPEMFQQLEKLIDNTPKGREKVARVREMMKAMIAQRQAKAQQA